MSPKVDKFSPTEAAIAGQLDPGTRHELLTVEAQLFRRQAALLGCTTVEAIIALADAARDYIQEPPTNRKETN